MEEDPDTNEFAGPLESDNSIPERPRRQKNPISTKAKRDNAIQGTNDSSIVSKRSVERAGYDIKSAQREWLRHFVKKPARRSPLINLGYFIRIKAIERVVDGFLAEPTRRQKIIVNLGCGYDPLPFVYMSHKPLAAMYLDVDYPGLIQHKSEIIRKTPSLAELLGSVFGDTSGEIRNGSYSGLGCDLTDLDLFDKVLHTVHPEPENCNILFISEVAITYMNTEAADALIGFTSKFPHATFAIIEQIIPAGPSHPFAVTMQNHFKNLSTPLQSLSQYPSLRSQARRFLDAGYNEIETCDLNTFFNAVVDRKDRDKALQTELFDEHEELGTFLQHYFVLVARNLPVATPYFLVQGQDWQYINWKKDTLLNGNTTPSDHCHESEAHGSHIVLTASNKDTLIRRRFAAMAPFDNGFIVQGGLSNTTRLSSSIILIPTVESQTFEISTPKPPARMCHTLTPVGNGLLLVGGRDAPNRAMSDSWTFNRHWKRVEDLPFGVYRHAAVHVKDYVVLFGGKRSNGEISADWLLYTPQHKWLSLHCENSPALWGACLSHWSGKGLLVGGINVEGECPGNVYTWSLDETSLTVKLESWNLSPHSRSLMRRYGAKLIPWEQNVFMLVGGAGSHRLIPRSENFVLLSSESRHIGILNTASSVDVEPWLVGHNVCPLPKSRSVVIIGGGGVCFSFGSFWNEHVFQLVTHGNKTRIWKVLDETAVAGTHAELTPSNSEQSPKSIRRVRITTPEQWCQVLQRSEICVLEGLDFGLCVSKWTPEYLKSCIGADKQVVVHSTDAEAMNFLSKNFKYITQSFNDFIDSVFSPKGEKVYLRAVSDDAKNKPARLEDDFPTLADDFRIPSILSGPGRIEADRIFSTVLRIGGVGSSIWLHYDVMANILTQVVGEKEILAFHPSMVNELNIPPGASSSEIANIFSSPVRKEGYSAILKPGDAIYIPPFWLHATKPLTPNVAINVFWKSYRDDVYDRGKDIYGNKDLACYTEGRRLLERIIKGFKDVNRDTREFYIKRLATELDRLSRQGQ